MIFFVTPWVITFLGWGIHVAVDRSDQARTSRRVVELLLLWVMVFGGAWVLLAAFGHLGPNSAEHAADIGYSPSMFQWELGGADAAIGVLGIGCAWRRDGWLTAAVVVLAICYLGDAIGHIMQLTVHDNTAPNNVWAIPSDIFGPLLAIGLLIAYRRMSSQAEDKGLVSV